MTSFFEVILTTAGADFSTKDEISSGRPAAMSPGDVIAIIVMHVFLNNLIIFSFLLNILGYFLNTRLIQIPIKS